MQEVYLLYMMCGTELQLYGAFTDKRMLLEAYNTLLTEDVRCSLLEDDSQKPGIYKLPLNKFIAWKVEGRKPDTIIYDDQIDNFKVNIKDFGSRIKIAEFCGFEVYCNLNFPNGPVYDVDYNGGDTPYRGQIHAESGEIIGNFDKYVRPVLKAWIDDNKEVLLEMWENRKLIAIPEWEE